MSIYLASFIQHLVHKQILQLINNTLVTEAYLDDYDRFSAWQKTFWKGNEEFLMHREMKDTLTRFLKCVSMREEETESESANGKLVRCEELEEDWCYEWRR